MSTNCAGGYDLTGFVDKNTNGHDTKYSGGQRCGKFQCFLTQGRYIDDPSALSTLFSPESFLEGDPDREIESGFGVYRFPGLCRRREFRGEDILLYGLTNLFDRRTGRGIARPDRAGEYAHSLDAPCAINLERNGKGAIDACGCGFVGEVEFRSGEKLNSAVLGKGSDGRGKHDANNSDEPADPHTVEFSTGTRPAGLC